MKSRKEAPRILLDTAFLLPTLGVDVGEYIKSGIEKLREARAEIYFSRFSILEALWVATRLMKKQSFDTERFTQGLRSILKSKRYLEVGENHRVFEDALRLYAMGHKDFIDNILYAISVNFSLRLLTVDLELRKFIKDKKLENTLISPDEI